MSNNMEFYGKPVRWSDDLSQITIQTKFMSPEQVGLLVDWINSGDKFIRIKISLLRSFSKTSGQLARYFRSIVRILTKNGIDPTRENVSHFDLEIKKSFLDCDIKRVGQIEIPFVPSKSEMDYETLYFLIQKLEETYSFLGIDFSLPADSDK